MQVRERACRLEGVHDLVEEKLGPLLLRADETGNQLESMQEQMAQNALQMAQNMTSMPRRDPAPERSSADPVAMRKVEAEVERMVTALQKSEAEQSALRQKSEGLEERLKALHLDVAGIKARPVAVSQTIVQSVEGAPAPVSRPAEVALAGPAPEHTKWLEDLAERVARDSARAGSDISALRDQLRGLNKRLDNVRTR